MFTYPNLATSTDSQLRAFCARVDRNGIWYAADEPDGTDAPRAYMLACIREWAAEEGIQL